MSMPQSSGCCRTGVAKVPSQTVMMLGPLRRARAAIAVRSVTFISGFEGVSTQTRRVLGRRAAWKSSMLGHIDVAGFEAPFAEDVADHFAQAPVDVVGRDDVVAGFESLHQGGGDGESGGEAERLLAAFERGEAFFQRVAVGIVLARVAEAARIFAVGAAFEGGGKVDGRGDRAGGGVDMAARVDGPGLNFHHCSV